MKHLAERIRHVAADLLQKAEKHEAGAGRTATVVWLAAHAGVLAEIANELDELRSTDMGKYADAIHELQHELADANAATAKAQADAAKFQSDSQQLADLTAKGLIADQSDLDAANSVTIPAADTTGGSGGTDTAGGAAGGDTTVAPVTPTVPAPGT